MASLVEHVKYCSNRLCQPNLDLVSLGGKVRCRFLFGESIYTALVAYLSSYHEKAINAR